MFGVEIVSGEDRNLCIRQQFSTKGRGVGGPFLLQVAEAACAGLAGARLLSLHV